MKNRPIFCFILCLGFMLSACGGSPSVSEDTFNGFNRAVSCHYSNHYQFDDRGGSKAYFATDLALAMGLKTDYLGFVLDDVYTTEGVLDRVNNDPQYDKSITIFFYRGADGKRFDLRFAKDYPKYIAAISHKPIDLGSKSAVIYKYGEETFARYLYGEYTFEVSCKNVTDSFFLELLNLVCPSGAKAPTGQTPDEQYVSELNAIHSYSPQYTADASYSPEDICEKMCIPQRISSFSVSSAEIRNYQHDAAIPDYSITLTHNMTGASAVIITSTQADTLPQWQQIGTDDKWSLLNLDRGHAIFFSNGKLSIVRCYSNSRYYEIYARDISTEEIKRLALAICS